MKEYLDKLVKKYETKDFISNFVEEKLPILKENTDFKEKYLRLSDAMDELDKTLSKNQKELFRR